MIMFIHIILTKYSKCIMTIAKECDYDCVIKIYFDTKFIGPEDLYEAIESDTDFEIYLDEKSGGFCDD